MNDLILERVLTTEKELMFFAAKLAKNTTTGLVIFLEGSLGAGKTTFARGFLNGLGYELPVKSPTYTIVEPYEIQGRHIFHFDLYRIDKVEELTYIGIQDYFFDEAICLVEWAEKGIPLLPKPDIACYISFMREGRMVRLIATSSQAKHILLQL